jgi:hypothetical protein
MPGVSPTIDVSEKEIVNLAHTKGDRFALTLELYNPADGSPYDVTNYISALMHVKRSARSSDIAAEFSTAGTLSTGLITIDSINSKIVIERNNLDIEIGRYVYDLEMTITTGAKQTILAGDFVVNQDVTFITP